MGLVPTISDMRGCTVAIEGSTVLIDQYYGNNHYHVTMVSVQIKEYHDDFLSYNLLICM